MATTQLEDIEIVNEFWMSALTDFFAATRVALTKGEQVPDYILAFCAQNQDAVNKANSTKFIARKMEFFTNSYQRWQDARTKNTASVAANANKFQFR
jgi:hypothetical protein